MACSASLLVQLFVLLLALQKETETTLRLESDSLSTNICDVQIFCMTPWCQDHKQALSVENYLCARDGLESNNLKNKRCLQLTGNHTVISLKLHPGKYQ